MKTDEEVIERLRRAGSAVRPPADPLDRLRLRQAAKHRRERVTAGVIAMVLFVAAVGGSLFALRGVWSVQRRVHASTGWTPDRSLEVGPGQYFYLKGTAFGLDGSTQRQETWWAPDGSGELRFGTNRPDKYSPYPPAGAYGTGDFPLPYASDPSESDLSGLSDDPGVLTEQVRERARRDGLSVWRAILRLLDHERAPQALPELRAALFDVAGRLDGVARRDGVEDPVGRDAIALAFTDRDECVLEQCPNWELFFDPGTHQLMDEAVGWDASPVPFLVLESAIVGGRGSEPTEDELLFPRPVRDPAPPVQPSPSLR